MTLGHPYPGQTDPDPCCTCACGVKIVATGKWMWAELEITACHGTKMAKWPHLLGHESHRLSIAS